MLSRDEMKAIKGGGCGTCCAHSASWIYQTCGINSSTAQQIAQQQGILWCCASCP